MLVLSRADLERLLPPADVIQAVRTAFREAAAGRVRDLPRAILPLDQGVIFLAMVAALPRRAVLGTKLVTVAPQNRRRGLPTLHASYVLVDPATGVPLALMEAGFLTAIRTGATSALAARYLARRDSRVVACFGASIQADYQLRCLQAVLPLDRVTVVGRDPERARRFATRMKKILGVSVTVTRDPAAAVADADVVTCATTSPTPVFRGRDLRPGTHVDAVGAFQPHTREVDTETVKRARVVVDTHGGAWEEAGDLLIPIRTGAITRRHVRAELADLVSGRKPGRRLRDEITLFKSVGWAAEDAATARLAYDRARARRIGTTVS
ncbi:MAG TPA: ornithine cyclodeaminase family protein, partial [Candidatus Limnocylindrales bacterium]|nr:ornithine cyclodeaminase family protein [Candidatus Limnocylindrales bacterium]